MNLVLSGMGMMSEQMKPTLVIMAAGIGSRYGGLKQMEPVGPSCELIIDYSIYDAIRAGFNRIVFVISERIQSEFIERIGNHIAGLIHVDYVNQRIDDLPDGFSPPTGRVKPWGTAHAVFCCRELISGPFAVINADDFYGAEVFGEVCGFLSGECERDAGDGEKLHCCMAGYRIENTLTENGHVSRGVCRISEDGRLTGITECTHVEQRDGCIAYTDDSENYITIEPGTVVSMNMWGFPAGIVGEFEPSFRKFLSSKDVDLLKTEYFLPFVVDELLHKGRADVKVLNTDAKWYGITYREDKEPVKSAITKMIIDGKYPKNLWNPLVEST
ncbi:MAG: nucleotidyltransferase [Oscillospiraceae bacterium]|nr:nucleotidyltransferase [Oscillospiraceae bacterium]